MVDSAPEIAELAVDLHERLIQMPPPLRISKGLPYRDLGEAYLDQIGQTRTVANLKRRLERLGYRVILELLEPNDQPT